MKKLMLATAATLGLLAFAPSAGMATARNNQAATYQWVLEQPNISRAPNGDTISLYSSTGLFSVHPKSANGGGSFTYTPAGGAPITGTWTVNGLITFQPYGCGVVFGNPLPPNFCGGKLKLDVTAHTPTGDVPAIVTVYCVIGNPPPSVREGVRVVVPGVANFNRQIEGMNVYIKQPPASRRASK